MRKTIFLIGTLAVLAACDKHDPILPGVRSDVFDAKSIRVLNEPVPNAPENITPKNIQDCPYTQKSDNTVWDDTRKIFSGFATNNSVESDKAPVCNGGFVYAGLTTGELVKINAKSRRIVWIADVYRQSNMMGGASILDIVAPIQIDDGYVYAGGLGGAFCKISDASGKSAWCVDISVEKPFIITSGVAFVLDTDNNINAIRLRDGAVYWRAPVEKSVAPEYQDKKIIVGREKIDAETGEKIK